MAETVLKALGLGESYLGFTMVMLANEFWREQVAAIPFHRRLLLLPHCLKNAEGCPADYDEFGLDCKKCGACSVADFRTKAEELGYKVLVTEGTPIVLKIIVSGHVDAIVGVACLNVLEKAFDKILLAGIPCVATPLLSSNCKNTSVDNDWVFELIDLHTPAGRREDEDLHAPDAGREPAVRGAGTVAARARSPRDGVRRQATRSRKHEAIAYDWLARGGKRSRPFITLAAYDALNGGTGHARRQRLGTARRGEARGPGHRERSTRRSWFTTTSRTTTPTATATRRCTASTASAPPSTSATTCIGLGYRARRAATARRSAPRPPPTSSTSSPTRT